MRLCMFHPADHPMKRGWVGRIDGDHVIHLAAQTLQAFFTGGGAAREHAVYPLDAVRLLAPVLHPPSVRVFQGQASFEFANPAAIVGPGSHIERQRAPSDNLSQGSLDLYPRVAAVLGAAGEIGGFTAFAEWRDPDRRQPKDRDFAFGLGPLVVTRDELDPNGFEATVRVDGEERLRGRVDGFDWTAARDLAAEGTVLRPGDLLAGPAAGTVESIAPGSSVQLAVEGIGELGHTLLRD
jgi:Fumarylacetoacetate (FAA) hydrolase family